MTITLQINDKQAEALQAKYSLADTTNATITDCLDKFVNRIKKDYLAMQDLHAKQQINEAINVADATQLDQIKIILGL